MKRLPMCEESILAIIAGRKHLTQRVIKPQPDCNVPGEFHFAWAKRPRIQYGTTSALTQALIKFAPFHVGDTVALTETWRIGEVDVLCPLVRIDYKADGALSDWIPVAPKHAAAIASWKANPMRWHSPYFMPAEFSRFHVTVSSVVAHRVQEMTIDDLIAEGWDVQTSQPWLGGTTGEDARAWYVALWDRLNGKRYPWASNPWVYGIGWE